MAELVISGAVGLLSIAALVLTVKIRKKVELPVFLFLIAFEIMVLLAAGWVLVIHGAIMEMREL